MKIFVSIVINTFFELSHKQLCEIAKKINLEYAKGPMVGRPTCTCIRRESDFFYAVYVTLISHHQNAPKLNSLGLCCFAASKFVQLISHPEVFSIRRGLVCIVESRGRHAGGRCVRSPCTQQQISAVIIECIILSYNIRSLA